MKENSIEEDMKYIHKTLNDMKIKDEDAFTSAVATIFRDYKRVLKENETYQKSDYETICLENNELREMTDRIQSEYNDLLKDNFKLKNELETKRKEYQETYKDVREELKELRKENEELKEYKKNAELTKISCCIAQNCEALNNAIKEGLRNQRLQKENEELKVELERQKDINTIINQKRIDKNYEKALEKSMLKFLKTNMAKDFVSVQKVKDIIDRIDYDIKKTKEIISKNTNIHATYRKNDYQIVRLRAMNTKSLDIKKRLQKLLESEE